MKITVNCLTLLFLLPIICGAPMPEYDVQVEPFEIMAIGPSAEQTLEEISRIKRSGSGDFFGSIKNKITSGIKSKFAQFSHGSSPSDDDHHEHYNPYEDVPHSYDEKSFNWWSLKKSILNTLLQAVKAINGGVLAIKGQLIKGGGHIISTKGKIISAKGEAISNLGRHIATSALLVTPGHSSSGHSSSGHSGPGHEDHHVSPYSASGPSSSGYSHSSGSAPSAPSAPISNHGFSSSNLPNSHYGAPPIPPTGGYGPPIESHLSANGFGSHKYQSAAEGNDYYPY